MLDLNEHELFIVRKILGTHLPGREVRAFGSRVTGKAKPSSDLDLAVMGDEPLPDAVHAEIVHDFEESDLPFRVDLLTWRDAPASLRQAIERDSVILNR